MHETSFGGYFLTFIPSIMAVGIQSMVHYSSDYELIVLFMQASTLAVYILLQDKHTHQVPYVIDTSESEVCSTIVGHYSTIV